MSMAAQLSGVAIIICIAFGVLTVVLLFIFANRQIKRFSLKSRSGPHVPIAHDSRKTLQVEIDRRLDVVRSISYQPKLLKKEEEHLFHCAENDIRNIMPLHLYRMKALDSLSFLDASVVSSDSSKFKLFSQDLRLYLLRLLQHGLLIHVEVSAVHQFADCYEFARHEAGDFNYEKYAQFMGFLDKIRHSLSPVHKSLYNNNKHYGVIPYASPESKRSLSNGKVVSPTNEQTAKEEFAKEAHAEETCEKKRETYETPV